MKLSRSNYRTLAIVGLALVAGSAGVIGTTDAAHASVRGITFRPECGVTSTAASTPTGPTTTSFGPTITVTRTFTSFTTITSFTTVTNVLTSFLPGTGPTTTASAPAGWTLAKAWRALNPLRHHAGAKQGECAK